ncbi:GPW/gp25 family protein [Xanthomonas translucens]|uniref:GPW/gp25 family protein n=1 Tax=Xanthomonas campestris pv. translucens TaxID=343 RepID=UPI0019D60D14|nr:GPW/gp25 family protein [Xanthomonas translucens]QSQ38924.1 GPW/gp25 family protein [Xanthomonas translucens pv. translucens]
MRGMDATTGKWIEGDAHLAQSIAQILTTPLGSRVQRRDFGSLLPELIDQPFNDATRVRLYGATATALQNWEPRLLLKRVTLAQGEMPGSFVLTLEGQRTDVAPANAHTRLTIPLRFRST